MITMTPDDLVVLLSVPPAARPETQTDTERLLRVLEGEPEVDEHENLAGAAADVIDRLRRDRSREAEQLAGILGAVVDTPIDALLNEVRELVDTLGARNKELIRERKLIIDRAADLRDALEQPEGTSWRDLLEKVMVHHADSSMLWSIHKRLVAAGLVNENDAGWYNTAFDAIAKLRQERDEARAKANAAIERNGLLAQLNAELSKKVGAAKMRTFLVTLGERGEATWTADPLPDAVPALSAQVEAVFGSSVSAAGVMLKLRPPLLWRPLEEGEVVAIGAWSFQVSIAEGDARDGTSYVTIRPLDGAPIVPLDRLERWGRRGTGEGLTIARAQREDPTADLIEGLASAIEGESGVDPRGHVVHEATLLIERLKDERACHERRRLDLAEKLGLSSMRDWDSIACVVERVGLVSAPVLRFSLAMQERLDAVCPVGGGRESVAWIRAAADTLARAAAGGDQALTRRSAAVAALHAMHIAQNEGDLGTFDATAEIAAARGKSE